MFQTSRNMKKNVTNFLTIKVNMCITIINDTSNDWDV